jgi:hypothetical protein
MAYRNLQIEGDPTIWVLSEPIDAPALTVSAEPFRAAISAPRAGTMLLSSRAAAGAVLTGVGGVTPNGSGIVTPASMYLPSVTGLKLSSPGYQLPAGTNLAALEGEITAAMSQSTFLTVECLDGVVVLNGATLPFVVLFPAVTGS